MENSESRIAHLPEPASDDSASPLNPAELERAYWRGVADGLARAGAEIPPDVAARAAEPEPAPDSSGETLPWDCEPPEESGRQRHDAFTAAKKQVYLKALAKHGCILDACRRTGISARTVYNHRDSDPEFDRHCRLALEMASTPLELTAYERAVVGQEEPIIRGGKVVGTRIRRSDYMLKIMLQASNPAKYGPRPGFTRKRLRAWERKEIEREIEARKAAQAKRLKERAGETASLFDTLSQRVAEIREGGKRDRRAQGWTELGCGIWVPPGWVWAGEGDPAEAVSRLEKNRDAVGKSCQSRSMAPIPGTAAGSPRDEPPNLSPPPRIP